MAKSKYKKNQGQVGIFRFFGKRLAKDARNDDGSKVSPTQKAYAKGRVDEMKKQAAMHNYSKDKKHTENQAMYNELFRN